MQKHHTPIDISNMPELVRLVEELKTTNTPRLLKKDSKDVALLIPVDSAAKSKRKAGKTQADFEAFKSSAGGWKGLVDTEKLKRDIYESRKISTRSPIVL